MKVHSKDLDMGDTGYVSIGGVKSPVIVNFEGLVVIDGPYRGYEIGDKEIELQDFVLIEA